MNFVVLKLPGEGPTEQTCYISGSSASFIDGCYDTLKKAEIEFESFAPIGNVNQLRAFGVRNAHIVRVGDILMSTIVDATYRIQSIQPAFDDKGRVLSIVYLFVSR